MEVDGGVVEGSDASCPFCGVDGCDGSVFVGCPFSDGLFEGWVGGGGVWGGAVADVVFEFDRVEVADCAGVFCFCRGGLFRSCR